MKYKFGFIGCGNMGGALIKAVSNAVDTSLIAVCDKDENKANAFAFELGVNAVDVQTLAKQSEYVVLGVKPQVVENAISEISSALAENESVTIISMCAGVTSELIKKLTKTSSCIRIMPNTPASVGEGIILYAPNGTTQKSEEEFKKYFSSAGLVVKIDEEKMDKHTAITGCGPAFVYMFIDAMKKSAVSIGVDEADAEKFCAQTVLGSAKMVLSYGNADQLKINVCSPGGSTIEGVKSLEKDDLYSVVDRAVQASKKRTEEMKK